MRALKCSLDPLLLISTVVLLATETAAEYFPPHYITFMYITKHPFTTTSYTKLLSVCHVAKVDGHKQSVFRRGGSTQKPPAFILAIVYIKQRVLSRWSHNV